MPQSRHSQPSTIPASFVAKKSQILSLLTQPEDEYTDKSPKGTVDHQILHLIQEINGYDGLVTTSSCAGRVAVFVEGPRSTAKAGDVNDAGEGEDEQMTGDPVIGVTTTNSSSSSSAAAAATATTTTTTTTATSPGGKGGGKWLYVSHDPIEPLHADGQAGPSTTAQDFTTLFRLTPSSSTTPQQPNNNNTTSKSPRLIHLTFSPLILHVHCATLRHARPLVAAAVNSGFRESGVQSLRVLDDPDHGVMVAIRTAGLSFETVVGVVCPSSSSSSTTGPNDEQPDTNREVIQSIVGEEYLAMCAGVVNERFRWNHERRERFRAELKRAMAKEGFGGSSSSAESGEEPVQWEDKDARRRRKREEGLARQRKEREEERRSQRENREGDSDELDAGLGALKVV